MAAQKNRKATHSSVWIELKPKAETVEAYKEACAALNRMMDRIVKPAASSKNGYRFEYWEEQEIFVYLEGEAGGFYELPDRGHWFNLDYMGRV